MPTRKHAAHRRANEQGAANAAPSSQAEGAMDTATQTQPQAEAATGAAASPEAAGAASPEAAGALDDVQVLWRKKETSTGSAEATAEPATAGEEAMPAAEEGVDWE